MKSFFVAMMLAGALAATGVFAQTTTETPAPKIEKSKARQQGRIRNGTQSGQLTAGEKSSIQGQEKSIQTQTQAERNANGGSLTNGEKAQVRKEQKGVSNHIARAKHNRRTQ